MSALLETKYLSIEAKKLQRDIFGVILVKKVSNLFSKLENRYFLHNALAAYKKNIKKYPFDENLTGKEDRYWADKIIKKN